MKIDLENIKNKLQKTLKPERYLHSLGVAEMAVELAKRFSLNTEKAELAGLIHDCAKNLSNEEMLKIIKENNLSVDESEIASQKTLHAPVGAFVAKNDFQIDDEEILSAIRFHTIGKINMTDFEKIIYLADKIETKTREPEYRAPIANVLDETNNLDAAMLKSYELTIKSLVERELPISYLTINIYNHLLKNLHKSS